MGKQIDVTVAVGTIDDGKNKFTVGDHFKIDEVEAKPLIDNGTLIKGKVDLQKPAVIGKATGMKINVTIDEKRLAEFTKAVRQLDEDNADYWAENQSPTVDALKTVAGFETSEEELDKLWPILESLM